MACHGLANTAIKKKTLDAMLKAGHPVEANFEIVKYSQGKLRHRFVPPNVNKNSKLNAADTARLFLGGQAAALVAAASVQGKVSHKEFNAAQNKRLKSAKKVLNAIKGSIPEAGKLLKKPSNKNALAFEAAIQGKDLSAKVKKYLPKPSTYK
jgi:hypothetical protein